MTSQPPSAATPSASGAAIIDTHLHVWDTSELGLTWVEEAGLPTRSMIPDPGPDPAVGPDADTDPDVTSRRYVLVEADAEDPAQELSWLLELARRDPRVHGVVAAVALEDDDVAEALTRVAAQPEVVGVRRLLQDRDLFGDPGLLRGLRLLAQQGLPFDACVRAEELPALRALLEEVPELTVVLDHMGKPPVSEETGVEAGPAMRAWRTELHHLAELPNLYCKLSGLPAECRDAQQLQDLTGDVVAGAVEAFGPQRCLLGSDIPVSSPELTPSQGWCRTVLDLIPAAHRADVAHRTAARIYRRRA